MHIKLISFSIVLIFLPFLPFLLFKKDLSQIPEHIQNLVSSNVPLDLTIEQNLDESLTELEIPDINTYMQKLKNLTVIHSIIGFFQIFGIIMYIWFFHNSYGAFSQFFYQNPSDFSIYIGVIIISFVSFYIFYGNRILNHMGLNNLNKTINYSIIYLYQLPDKIFNHFLHLIYFFILVFYIKFFLPLFQSIGLGIPLIEVFIVISLFYYGVPRLFSVIYSKYKSNADSKLIFMQLKNNTYLYFLIIYFFGLVLADENNFLLAGIGVLFLFDNYLQTKEALREKAMGGLK